MEESHQIHLDCPIDESRDEIRVFNLQPGDWYDIIEGTFSTVSLLQVDEPYFTLSYVWGDSKDYYSIFINGEDYAVTESAFTALRRLRAHNHDRPLRIWVDAFCIDQKNLNERSQQVRMMDRIYSQCEEVFIWLGESLSKGIRPEWGPIPEKFTDVDPTCYRAHGNLDEISEETWRLLASDRPMIAEDEPITWSLMARLIAWFIRCLGAGHHPTIINPLSGIENNIRLVNNLNEALVLFNATTYSQRLWCVQEVVLAPVMRIFFGPISLREEILVGARHNLSVHNSKGCCKDPGVKHNLFLDLLDDFMAKFTFYRSLGKRRLAGELDKPMLEICLELMERRATVDLDRVYALNGISPHAIGVLTPNYRLSVKEVYEEFTREYIKATGSLLPLIFAGMKGSYHELPSWSIDWTIFGGKYGSRFAHMTNAWYHLMPNYNLIGACGKLTQNIAFRGSELCVHGIEIDTISSVTEHALQPQTAESFSVSVAANWLMLVAEQHSPGNFYKHADNCTWNEAWLRTLCADICEDLHGYRRMTEHDVQLFIAHLLEDGPEMLWTIPDTFPDYDVDYVTLHDGQQIPKENHRQSAMGVSRIISYGRRLFLTESGYIGIGNVGTKPGDKLFVLPGAPTPLILREDPFSLGRMYNILSSSEDFTVYVKKEDSQEVESERDTQYSVVSDCYVHGLMDGEGIGGKSSAARIIIT